MHEEKNQERVIKLAKELQTKGVKVAALDGSTLLAVLAAYEKIQDGKVLPGGVAVGFSHDNQVMASLQEVKKGVLDVYVGDIRSGTVAKNQPRIRLSK